MCLLWRNVCLVLWSIFWWVIYFSLGNFFEQLHQLWTVCSSLLEYYIRKINSYLIKPNITWTRIPSPWVVLFGARVNSVWYVPAFQWCLPDAKSINVFKRCPSYQLPQELPRPLGNQTLALLLCRGIGHSIKGKKMASLGLPCHAFPSCGVRP